MSNKRAKGVTIHRKIIYGSIATPISNKSEVSDPSHTHRWSIYVKSADGHDMPPYIKKIVFKLHESFATPSRTIDQPPYEVTETGWGEFEIMIKIFFVDPSEKPQILYHHLQLYPKEDGGANPQKKPVVSEHYDEIVFHEPNDDLNQVLSSQTIPDQLSKDHAYNTDKETKELEKIIQAHEEVITFFQKYKTQLNEKDKKLKELQGRIKELEEGDD